MGNTLEVAAVLKESLDKAQAELSFAEIALIEATARAEEAREAALRLVSAVAALSGERPPAVAENVSLPGVELASKADDGGSTPSRDAIKEMTPEEFDRHRRQKQRAREKEALANNPLAHIKCTGCGRTGTLQDTVVTAPSGATVRMMVCGGCGNQVMT